MKRWIAILAVLAGCNEDGSSSPGPIGLVVSNSPNQFSIASGGSSHTGVFTYAWPCSDDQARISLAEGIGSGTVRIEVFDHAGLAVHDNTYPGVLGGATVGVTKPGGMPGTWTVRFTFTSATWGSVIHLSANPSTQSVDIAAGYSVTGAALFFDLGFGAGTANVNVAAGLGSGTVRIRVWDGAGALVYDTTFFGPMGAAVSDLTAPGAAGSWLARLDFTNTSSGGAIVISQP